MKFFPYERITFNTRLSKGEVLKRLKSRLDPKDELNYLLKPKRSFLKPYSGKIWDDQFKIKRSISYQNSFLPVIFGRVDNDTFKTRIHIKMRLSTFIIVFMMIWMGGVSIGCIAIAIIILDEGFKDIGTLVPFIMWIFGYCLMTIPFKWESTKSIKYLTELFEAEIEDKNKLRTI